MRVLLVTWIEQLLKKLSAFNPELEYCAIVVDEVEPAKEILSSVGLSHDLLRSMSELKTCLKNFEYDYILCLQDKPYDGTINVFKKYKVPTEKLMSFANLQGKSNFQTERHLRYYREHSKEFGIFATGTSTTEAGIDIRRFKYKGINFATSSQDLYYNLQIAKAAIQSGDALRYALIGLAPYSFHFNLSRAFILKCRLLPYFIAFNDLHNFPVPADVYKTFLREEWLTKKLSIKKINLNGVKSEKVISQKVIEGTKPKTWNGKYYPATRDMNVKVLDDYLTLCEENNVRPIMFRVIVSEKYMANFNKELLDEFLVIVEQACQKHPSACFVDGWKLEGFTYDDFYDHGHLNRNGAAKFSAYLNDFIEQLESDSSIILRKV